MRGGPWRVRRDAGPFMAAACRRLGLGDESEVDLRLSRLVNITLRLDLARLR